MVKSLEPTAQAEGNGCSTFEFQGKTRTLVQDKEESNSGASTYMKAVHEKTSLSASALRVRSSLHLVEYKTLCMTSLRSGAYRGSFSAVSLCNTSRGYVA